jgi:hypothetical protein
MGRPKKHAGTARDKLMQVRVRQREYGEFKNAADSAGLDLSSWVRERLLMAAKRDMGASKKPR